ncbi:glycosyltransferase family 2 protein [Leptospira borgpetersenii]|uniref:Glycosyltransferase n=1 Tax=Leptospira borgpetersenii serovar Hardjo-bovis (strain JB197) TaxID=355277 RepID=Q04TH8_LEPBJ|nr:glycosyltransferase family 2 protein [Leptospira borgpetersenii]ABJ75792.1 Glycosyltransferase [Leptospira borgpetersenii serovar Hardjo-bovis str. JB197]AMX70932.1 glycosyl transferase [Leptospira borgpetersenii serovar Hardjo]TQE54978.1 glycosyltransferase family 2 protein [Leptospira borgpetersenii]
MKYYNIITITYNSEKYISALDWSIKLPSNWTWVIWDNDSKDGTQEQLKLLSEKDRRLIHFSPKNLGFAGGNNEAIKIAPKSDWTLLINPDSRLSDDFFSECEKTLESKGKEYSIVSFLMLKDNQVEKKLIDGAGDIYHVSGAAWRRGYKRVLSEEYLRESEIFSACGGAMAIRTEVYKRMGGFDSDFFCYMEDVDLSFRARLTGERVLFSPNIKVYHHGFGSTKEKSAFSLYYGLRNALVVYWKNMPLSYALRYIFHHMFFFGVTICFHAIFTSPKMLGVPFGFLKMLPGIIRKRFEICNVANYRSDEILIWMSRGWFTPFRKK